VRYLTLGEVLELHRRISQHTGGATAVRDLGALESAVAQPRLTGGGAELYPTVASKASVLGFSLIQNHPFVDGNKRVGHAAIETFLVMNGFELQASVEDAEALILGVARGDVQRDALTTWLEQHLVDRPS
jgi:death-on-curing protein